MDLPRRRLLIGGSAAAVLVACGHPRRSPEAMLVDSPGPLPPVEEQLADLEDRYDAKVGLHGVNLQSGRALDWRADDLFATCSTFKAYVAAQILQKSQLGEVRLDDIVGQQPLSELCAAAVRQSDNASTNLLLGVLGGPPSVTEFARSVGDERTWMVRWEPDLNTAYPGDPRDTTSPRAMGTGFLTMLTGDVLDEPHRAQLNEWMRTIVTGDRRIRAGLPAGWTVADKTGTGDYASANDIGVAFGPDGERLLLAVMTRSRSDDPQAVAQDGLIADITTLAVPWLLGAG